LRRLFLPVVVNIHVHTSHPTNRSNKECKKGANAEKNWTERHASIKKNKKEMKEKIKGESKDADKSSVGSK
jgi:hypothetical protein